MTTNDSGDTGRVFTVDPATGQTVGRDRAGPTTRPTSRRWRPAGRGDVWVGDIGDNTAVPRLDRGDPGAGRPRRPHRRRADRTSWPTPTAPHDAETLLVAPDDGAALRRRPRTSSAARSTPRRARLDADGTNRLRAVGDGAADRHRRRVLPRRAARRAARLLAGGRLHLPGPARRSARSGCPTRSRARASRSTPTAAVYVSSEGAGQPVLRVAAAGRRTPGRWRRRRAARRLARARVGHRRPDGPELPEQDDDRPAGLAVVPHRLAGPGRPGRAGPLAAPPLTGVPGREAPSRVNRIGRRVARLRDVPRTRRTSPDQPGWTRRRAGRGFVYLDEDGDRLAEERRPAGARPGDPARVGGRLDLRRRRTATCRRSAPTTPGGGSTSTTRTGGPGGTRRSSTGCWSSARR